VSAYKHGDEKVEVLHNAYKKAKSRRVYDTEDMLGYFKGWVGFWNGCDECDISIFDLIK
jgi:hypothetical protein